MSLPPPLPTRWGRVPALAPVVAALAAQAQAQHAELQHLARRSRLPLHVVAELPEVDSAELVELHAEDLEKAVPAASVEPSPLPSPRALPASAPVLAASARRPGSTRVRELDTGGRSSRVARPRWSRPRRALPQAVPAPSAKPAAVAARRRAWKRPGGPSAPLNVQRPAAPTAGRGGPHRALRRDARERARASPSETAPSLPMERAHHWGGAAPERGRGAGRRHGSSRPPGGARGGAPPGELQERARAGGARP